MIRSLMHRFIRSFERRYGYDATYLREIADASPAAFAKFALMQPMNAHRDGVSKDALYAARITAVRAEDCGPCAQLVVDMALEAGVAPAQVRAIAARDEARMSSDALLGMRLADAVSAHAPTDAARAAVLARFGEKGLVTLAYSVACTRIFPTLKRALGHAHTCERLRVHGETVVAARAAA